MKAKHLTPKAIIVTLFSFLILNCAYSQPVEIKCNWMPVTPADKEWLDSTFSYYSNLAFYEGLMKMQKHGKWGFIDTTGQWVIEPRFEAAGYFSEGLSLAKKNGKYGFIDKTGEWVIKPQFDDIAWHFTEGLAYASKGWRWGVIDTTGQWVIQPLFYDLLWNDFSKSIFCKLDDNMLDVAKWNYSDDMPLRQADAEILELCKKWNLPTNMTDADKTEEWDRKWGLFNKKTGERVIELLFDDVSYFDNGLTGVKKDEKWGLIDTSGMLVFEPQFDDVRFVSNGYYLRESSFVCIVVEKDGKIGFIINKDGQWILEPPKFDRMQDFLEGLAAVKRDGKWGFIDKNAQLIIGLEFDDVGCFYGNFAKAKKEDKWGFIDRTGQWVIKPQFDELGDILGNSAPARRGGKWGFIDQTGRWVIKPRFDSTAYFSVNLT